MSARPSGGTTHLRNHMTKSCPNKPNIGLEGSPVVQFEFDQAKSRTQLAIACIKHKYPFNIAEHEFFEAFLKGLNPHFDLPSRNTIRADVINVYKEEKIKMYKLLGGVQSRMSLTTDIWSSEHSHISYCCLTVHFIDEDWELHKRIIAFRKILYPHGGECLFDFMRESILYWNLDKKVFSVVVDNATSNDSMISKLKDWLVSRDLIDLNGDLLHVRCSAHILNLVVQDGLSQIRGLIEKIRETARYLKKSPKAAQMFETALDECNLKDKRQLAMDVPNRWNSTYDLLETALPLKEAFCRLEKVDKHYEFNPSELEWVRATAIHECLLIFYEVTRRFSGSKYPTSNVFFPDICELHLKMNEWEQSEHGFIKSMVCLMKQKFLKYWDKCCLILAVAVVFDPRYKMGLVEYYYTSIYDRDADRYVKRVLDTLKELFLTYGGGVVGTSTCDTTVGSSSIGETRSVHCRYQRWLNEKRGSVNQKLEWEIYLEEQIYPDAEDFNILGWWKMNSLRFPILAKIARDILAVSATTVASEAAFSVGGRVIDESRASLGHDVVEALIAADDWIKVPIATQSVPIATQSSGSQVVESSQRL